LKRIRYRQTISFVSKAWTEFTKFYYEFVVIICHYIQLLIKFICVLLIYYVLPVLVNKRWI